MLLGTNPIFSKQILEVENPYILKTIHTVRNGLALIILILLKKIEAKKNTSVELWLLGKI